ncbi:MAG: DUF2273 domain-containing protein [Peptococcaceae bacterium]|jgi:uncharacterized membrane protein|nr:DUF2273 domain-containing protein [Peptococcaceae bacterium]
MKEFWRRIGQRATDFLSVRLEEQPGRLIGAACGLLLGLFVILVGFWQAVAVCLFVFIGLFLGKCWDEGENPLAWLQRRWPK